MKKIIQLMLFLFIFTVSIFAAWDGIIKSNNVKMYEDKAMTKEVMTLQKDDPVTVLVESSGMYQVEAYGKKGWVEKKYVEKARGLGKKLTMEGENILGELGDIEIVTIMVDEDSKLKGIKLDRSFKDELKAPVDKERLERKNTEYIRW